MWDFLLGGFAAYRKRTGVYWYLIEDYNLFGFQTYYWSRYVVGMGDHPCARIVCSEVNGVRTPVDD